MASSTHTHEHHIVPTRTYVATFLGLVVLMVMTVAIAGVNLPAIGPLSGTVVNQLVALLIAVVKAMLVISIFMGVKWGSTLTKLWVASGFVTLIVLFGILGDYTTRQFEHQPGWEKQADGALPRVTPNEPEVPAADSNTLNVKIRQ